MKKLIVLNHKMNLDYDEVYDYISKLNNIKTDNDLIVCPSNIYLTDFINNCSWGVASQNVSDKESGNYTGEVSTTQLKSLGVEYSIIGHYERKKYFHETNKIINKKLIACLETNIIPILCFGETGDQDDIQASLDELLNDIENINFIIFAYEPLKVVENESITKIKEQIEIIYNYLYEKYGTIPKIIYGGGISKKDINELLDSDKVNGILIGKISADIEKCQKIITSIN